VAKVVIMNNLIGEVALPDPLESGQIQQISD
jgi:hypothetical protein